MQNRIVKIVLENGNSIDYKEQSIEHFRKTGQSESWVKNQFFNQRQNWEKNALTYFNLDIEEYAKAEYDLIDEDERKEIGDYDDDDILSEAEYRGILPVSAELQNENILNEDFVARFVEIINRGNTAEIENTLSFIEYKFKI
ncbi:hypothetical protein PFY12_14680 [Chryseobacterium camelliae]|uniref:Uncharacterized protein n=1 Tax=Chryseobacterium camelliae TaxID=1265445 RepID=A0ABY7QKR5_9FLAO|nr:hypothetical protein [Chryseobacterium camelliae]WBV60271.1 hypothetical protein PFY12_14680 [Chryseobacterium camelliae]